jgi:putative membrane protein
MIGPGSLLVRNGAIEARVRVTATREPMETTMNFKTLALVSVAALSLAACGKKGEDTAAVDNGTYATTTATDVNAAGANDAMATPASGGQAFVNMAGASDAFEIETSKLAAINGASAAVKKFATQMITAHEGSTAKLKAVTATLSPALTPNPALSAEQQQKLADLKTKQGVDFDAAYAAGQVAGHQQTLDMLKGYAATGDVPQLKTFASGLAPTVAAHLNMAKSLKS